MCLHFSLVLFLCVTPMLGGRLLALLLLSVALHEAGHLLFLAGCRASLRQIEFSLRGVRMDTDESLPIRQTILLNLSGPLMNILSAGFAVLLLTGIDVMRFCAVSLTVGAVNLIPFGTTDGAAALEAAAALCRNPEKAKKLTSAVRLFIGGAILLATALECIRNGWQWFYLPGVYYFAAALVEDRGGLWYHN